MNQIKIPYINLTAQWEEEKKEILPLIKNVFSSGQFIGGQIIDDFENSAAKFCGTKYCVALNSGTDALVCGLIALGVKRGDEVITPPNSFVASTSAIVHIGAKPVFVDVLNDQNIDPIQIKKAITDKTSAIMPVHLTGRMAKMDKILEIGTKNNIPIIEDCAQSIGSQYNTQKSGSFGKIGCFSTHPLKNLNACGDGGFITTNDKKIADKIKQMRNHGFIDRNTAEHFGYVSRMDSLQASILNYRIKKLNIVINKRRKNAQLYFNLLKEVPILLPFEEDNEYNSYHTFVIQTSKRDQLAKYLLNEGVETAIHYPFPIHLQPAAKFLNYHSGSFPITEKQANTILTIPIHQYLSEDNIIYICKKISMFFK